MAGAVLQLSGVNKMRKDYALEQVDPFADEKLASEFQVPTAALFTFRALAVDYLWIRAENLKENGQFFDANHLARMICVLQPHLAEVWDFQAWNMAYNISVEMPTPGERWLWVMHGVELLRDQGIPKNPKKIKLYHTLANTFFHKMGGITDDDHRFYKWQLAKELGPLLNKIYSDTNDGGDKKDIEMMAKMPEDLSELLKDEAIAKLVDRIKEIAGGFENDDEMILAIIDRDRIKNEEARSGINSLIEQNKYEQSMIDLDLFVRAYQLRNKWKLEPAEMVKVNEQYGPRDLLEDNVFHSLDWRLPWTQGLYWAKQGLAKVEDMNVHDAQNLNRMVYHCLQDLYKYGKMTIYLSREQELLMAEREKGQEILAHQSVEYLPVFNSQDLRMLDVAYKESANIVASLESEGYKVPGGVDSFISNLVRNGVFTLYLQGRELEARRKYNAFAKDNPGNEAFQQPIETFVVKAMKEEIESITPQYATVAVLSNLTNAYKSLVFDEEDNAARLVYLAEEIFKKYKKEFPDADDFTQRTTLPYMSALKAMAAAQVFDDPQIIGNPGLGDKLMARINLEEHGEWLFDQLKPVWDAKKQKIQAERAKRKAQQDK
ncbi:MAG: hypothetical protein JEZ07_09845 [Phycisphaerae bacterium]|nr:hypothetical protein [Phycisphaerae bacterium]